MFARGQQAPHHSTEGIVMSRITNSLARTVPSAMLFAAAWLLAPGAAWAQSIRPERALLQVTNVAPSGAATVHPAPAIDGEHALLGKSSADVVGGNWQTTQSLEEFASIDGSRALLGRGAKSKPRRTSM